MQHLNINFKNVLFFAVVYVICTSILQAQEGQNTAVFHYSQQYPDSIFTKSQQKYTNETDEGKYVLDSTYTYDTDDITGKIILAKKEYYTYDEYGYKKTNYSYFWDLNLEEWIYGMKGEYSYNFEDNSKIYLTLRWNKYDKIWENYSKIVQIVDGAYHSESTFYWHGNYNKWKGHEMTTITLNENGETEEEAYYWWSSKIQDWKGISKSTKLFDDVGNKIGFISYDWIESCRCWRNTYKKEFLKDENDNILEYESSNWDTTKNIWVGSSKYDAEYDEFGNQTMEIRYKWDKNTREWQYSKKENEVFDSVGNTLNYESYYWDTIQNIWYGTEKRTQAFNTNNDKILIGYFNWDTLTNTWLNYYKSEWVYYKIGKPLEFSGYSWNQGNGSWVNTYKQLYSYDEGGNSLGYKSYFIGSSDTNRLLVGYGDVIYSKNGKTVEDVSSHRRKINGEEYYEGRKTIQIYDSEDRLLSSESYIKCEEFGEWIQSNAEYYSYSNNWKKTEWIRYSSGANFDCHKIYPVHRNLTIKDDSITIQEDYTWNRYEQKWIPNEKSKFSVDKNGNYILIEDYKWDVTSWNWSGIYKKENVYCEDNKRIMEASYNWSANENEWYGKDKTMYVYENDKIKEEIYFDWDSDTKSWYADWKQENIYDLNMNLIEEDYYRKKNDFSDSLKLYYIVKHYWSLHTEQERFSTVEHFRIYPNPATDELWFYLNHPHNEKFTVQLYNLYGELVFSDSYFEFIRPFGISVSSFPRGLYILNVKSETIDESQKIILK